LDFEISYKKETSVSGCSGTDVFIERKVRTKIDLSRKDVNLKIIRTFVLHKPKKSKKQWIDI